MNTWRKLGVALSASFLTIALFGWGFVFTSYQMLAGPERLKETLETSGVYETLVNDVLKEAEKRTDQGDQKIATELPEVQQAIKNAATPDVLKSQVEGFLDSTYGWIRGESEGLAFQIDLTEVKAKLGDNLAASASSRLATLPTCSGTAPPESFDPFTAGCIPRGLDKNAAVAEVRSEVDKAIKDPLITQDNLNGQGESLEQKLQAVPTIYNNLVLGMWLGALLVALFTVGVVFLSSTWRAGLKRVGIIFVSVGAISAGLAMLSAFLIKQAAKNLTNEGEIQHSALNIVSQLADGFRGWWLIFGIIILVLGVAALVIPKFIKPEKNEEQKLSEGKHQKTDSLPESAPKKHSVQK